MAKDIDELYEEANEYFYDHNYEKAIEKYTEIIKIDPNHADSYEKLAQIYSDTNDKQKAIDCYKKYTNLEKENAGAFNDMGNIYFDLEEFDEAIKCYREAIAIDDQYYWSYYNIGLAEERKSSTDEARDKSLKWFEKTIKINPQYSPALNELGLYYLDMKNDLEKAEKYFKKCIKADRKYKYPYYNLADIEKQRDNIEKAIDYYKMAINCDKNYIGAYNNLGIIYYDDDDYNSALYYYTKALKIDPAYKYSLYNCGLIFDDREQYKKAYEVYKKALESDPNYQPAIDEIKRLETERSDEIKKGEGLKKEDLDPATYKNKIKTSDTRRTSMNFDDIIDDEKDDNKDEDEEEKLYIERFGRNITKMAREGKLYEVIGRDKEIRSILEVLYKMKKNNPIIVGKAGVGKTAIVEGLAQMIVNGKAPEFFNDMEIVELNLSMLLAGTNYRGDFEKRLKKIIEELQNKDKVIMFIDEIHTIVGAGEVEGGHLDAANILKPALARGDLRCIGATTTEEYKKYFQKDAALDRRFYKIDVKELSPDVTLEILRRLKPKLEKHYKITIEDNLLNLIIELSAEEIKNRVFPDKALDIIEKVFSRCALEGKKKVDGITIKNIIGEFVGIKFIETEEDKGQRLLNMEKFLSERVYGQQEAIDKISNIVRMTKQKLDLNPEKPDGVFFFAGPTGVGKTYLAKQLAQFLYGDENKLIVINMSEFTEPHSISKLIGSPPGYVGYDDVGIFGSKILDNPSSVLLLDEIEKAHPEVLKIFLRIFDEGKIEDTKGREIYFSNVTIIMTSNAIGITNNSLGFGSEQSKSDVKLAEAFPAEFVNRIDEVIIFNYIEKDVARDILTNLIITKTKKRFEKRGISLDFNPIFIDYILERGYSRKFGVRNLERTFEKEALTAISNFLFRNPNITDISITIENGKVSVQ